MLQWLIKNVLGKIAAMSVRRRLAAFEEATCHPRETQEALLRRILTYHENTDFARVHHFRDIKTLADYRRHMPITTYEYVQPYIERVTKGDFGALLADTKVHMFALTSGTTATRKYIPVTPQYLADYRRGWNLWGLKVFRDHREVRFRPIVQLSGDWQELSTPAGIPCGAVTGLTAHMQLKIIRWLYCVPSCVGKVKDPAAKYYLALRLSVPRKVGMVIAANPSTLVNLARLGDKEKETLLRDMRDGTLDPRFDVPPDVRAALANRLKKKHPERVAALEEIVRRTGTLYPKDYWPSDCILGNWMGGSMGAYLRQYPTYFGDTPVRDVGLIASEGRMTIPMSDGTASGTLDVTTHFFEFIPEDEIKSPQPTVLAAHEIVPGRNYYILLTTAYGLYRYNIYDVVRCTGFHNRTPLVEFLSKGSLFSNLTGEKVSEYHVSGAMSDALRQLDMRINTYSLAPCWDDRLPYYGLFVERGDIPDRATGQKLAQNLERRLAEVNEEYASKRQSLRLGPIRIEILAPGTWSEWDRKRLARTGGSLEQYKHPSLIADAKLRESLPVEEEIMPQIYRHSGGSMVYLSRIYTKSGDRGDTGLGDGERVPKDHPRVAAYGDVDELNSVLGLLLASCPALDAEIAAIVRAIQNDLFDVGADLCVPLAADEQPNRALRVRPDQAARLESLIDRYNEPLQPLASFVLPGGSPAAAWCHLARTVCRRAERAVVALMHGAAINPDALIYLNRLSDLLFVLGRVLNDQGKGDILWVPGGAR